MSLGPGGRLALGTILFILALHLESMPIAGRDFWHHLEMGREIVSERAIPQTDRFTHTIPGARFVDLNWLFQALAFLAYRAGGLGLVVVLHTGAIVAGFAMAGWAGWRRSLDSRSTLAALGLALLASFQNMNLRPQSLAILWFGVTIALCEGVRQGRRPLLALLPVVTAAWANSHGTFPVGILWTAAVAVEEALDRLRRDGWSGLRGVVPWILALGGMAAGSLANPAGARIYEELVENSRISTERGIAEWAPLGFGVFSVWIFAAGSACALGALFAGRGHAGESGQRESAAGLLAWVAFSLLALRGLRMIVWWAMATVPVFATLFARVGAGTGRRREAAVGPPRAVRFCAWGAMAAALVAFSPWAKGENPLVPPERKAIVWSDTPVGIARAIRENSSGGKLFHPMIWGAWFIWDLAPEFKVFIDPRFTIFPESVWREYRRIARAEDGWAEILDARGVRIAALRRADAWPLARALARDPGWRAVHSDELGEVYLRVP